MFYMHIEEKRERCSRNCGAKLSVCGSCFVSVYGSATNKMLLQLYSTSLFKTI